MEKFIQTNKSVDLKSIRSKFKFLERLTTDEVKDLFNTTFKGWDYEVYGKEEPDFIERGNFIPVKYVDTLYKFSLGDVSFICRSR